MYQRFYSLKENPFRLTPDPAFMCMTAQHQEALSGLIYSVCTRPGLTVLMGEAGTGKTTLLYSLLGLLEKRRFVTAMCNNPTLTRQEFYDLLIMKFGVDCSSSLKSRQLVALEEMFHRNRADERPAVLIVDEAQRLSPELLEEIRLLLNVETPREKLLQIIIAGQPELWEVLRRPELRQLKQRVSCVCRLKPLSLEELHEYLHHRLTRAGLESPQTLFPDTTVRLIYEYTQGIPRLVNSLCDSALQTGFALQAARITPAIIEEAAKDLDLVQSGEPAEDALVDLERSLASGHAGTQEMPPLPVRISVAGANGKKKNGTMDSPVPVEASNNRQKNVSFFANLIDRWK